MRAIYYKRYGTPDRLLLKTVPKPQPQAGEVLLKVRATSINEWDAAMLHGGSILNRLMFGLFRPQRHVLGDDVAGTVEALGDGVTGVNIGDKVFADLQERFGGLADYACVPAESLVPMPQGLSFAEAAAIPQAGILAYFGLMNCGQLKKGQRVLINGAGGGVGTIAVQIARHIGAKVTAVDRAGKLDALIDIGAHHVIDYENEPLDTQGGGYDLILEVIGMRAPFALTRLLSPTGRYVMVGGTTAHIAMTLFLGFWGKLTGSKKRAMLLDDRSPETLPALKALIEDGHVAPVVDRIFPLERTQDAYRCYEADVFVGKIVIDVDRAEEH